MAKILITGSSSGIGMAAAESFLSKGHEVIGISRRIPQALTENLSYTHYQIDLSKLNDLKKKFKEITEKHPDLSIVILNAGMGLFKEIDQISTHDIIKVVNVNLVSQMILLNLLVKNLRKISNAKIIFIGSEAGLSGSKKSSIYSATKFAIRGFAQSLQKDLSNTNIQVNLLNPGAIETEFYNNLNFIPGGHNNNSISVKQITDLINFIIEQKNNFYFEEINLKQIQRVFNNKSIATDKNII